MKVHNLGYRDENVRLHDINGGADLHITPTELLFTALSGYLPGGGDAKGQLKIENWLGEASPDSAASSPTTVAAANDGELGSEEYWGEGSDHFVEVGTGADRACVSDGGGGAHTAAHDHGCDGDGRLWRFGIRYRRHGADDGGVGRTGEGYF